MLSVSNHESIICGPKKRNHNQNLAYENIDILTRTINSKNSKLVSTASGSVKLKHKKNKRNNSKN